MSSLWQVRSWRVPIHTDLSLVAGPIKRRLPNGFFLLNCAFKEGDVHFCIRSVYQSLFLYEREKNYCVSLHLEKSVTLKHIAVLTKLNKKANRFLVFCGVLILQVGRS